jgi:hypothetical protein
MIGRYRQTYPRTSQAAPKNIGAENFSNELPLAKVFLTRVRAENAHRAMRRCE